MTDSSLLYAPEDQCLSTIFMIINNFALILKFAPLLPHTHYPPSPPPQSSFKAKNFTFITIFCAFQEFKDRQIFSIYETHIPS